MVRLKASGWLSNVFADATHGAEAAMTRSLDDMISDIHSHRKDKTNDDTIFNLSVKEYIASKNSVVLCSIGVHPWHIDDASGKELDILESIALNNNIVAIGETGIDLIKSSIPLYRQLLVFKRHIDISEKARKPLIIHNVKAHDIIIGLQKEVKPQMPWIIHGFRNKPSVAKMLTDAGMYLSFGEHFNADTIKSTPTDRILVETDESDLTITEIIDLLTAASGINIKEIAQQNAKTLFR